MAEPSEPRLGDKVSGVRTWPVSGVVSWVSRGLDGEVAEVGVDLAGGGTFAGTLDGFNEAWGKAARDVIR